MKIAIIGMGTVGRAQAELFAGEDLVTYDLADDGGYPHSRIASCDFAVICVPTPAEPRPVYYDWEHRRRDVYRADLSQVTAAVAALPPGLPALLRSTVPPGTTAKLRAARLSPVCHAPEFLTERKNGEWPRSADVPFVILGGEPEDREIFAEYLENYYMTVYECSAAVAELAKYTANLHWATKVTFVNEMAAITAAAGEEWDDVRRIWLADSRVDLAYTEMDGFPPGFGGSCWPKDLAALIAFSTDNGHEPEFLWSVHEANGRFRDTLQD